MILRSLEDLDSYKNIISTSKPSISLKDINQVQISGGESTNVCKNKLFYWNFEPKYIQQMVNIYENLRGYEIDNKRISKFKFRLQSASQEMIDKGICPIEAILYSSKAINSLILYNNDIIEVIGEVITNIYNKNTSEYKETIKFILNEWSWDTQIIMLINACGKIKDHELLQLVYKNHTNGDKRIYALKAFMGVNDKRCIEYSLKLMSEIEESDNTEVQMAKYFIHNYVKSFGNSSIVMAERYLESSEINKQAKKIISRVIPKLKKEEVVTLNAMIRKAKNWELEEDFEISFRHWMNNRTTRKNAFLAIRYSNFLYVDSMILDVLENQECNSIEIGTAIITLAQWGSRKGTSSKLIDLINENKKDVSKKVYTNAAMCSLGYSEESLELIREYIEEKYYDNRQIFSIIRDCAYKSNQLLKTSVKSVYQEYLNSNDDEKVIKAINGAYELCNNPKFNFKNIVLKLIKDYIGVNGKSKQTLSTEVYASVINLVERLLDDKNKNEFIDILFFIIENEGCNKVLKVKATSVLKRLSIDPPK